MSPHDNLRLALAKLAGINQITAGRCYRRLQDNGAVVSEVGRGTFVRAAAPRTLQPQAAGDARGLPGFFGHGSKLKLSLQYHAISD